MLALGGLTKYDTSKNGICELLKVFGKGIRLLFLFGTLGVRQVNNGIVSQT